MDTVKCRHCRTRVVPGGNGCCPYCGKKLRGSSVITPGDRSAEKAQPTPRRSAVSPTERSPDCLDRAVGQIDEMLRLGRLPRNCSVCRASTESVCEVWLQHEDVTLLLPVRICRRCAIRASLLARETVLPAAILSLALMMLVVFVATPDIPLALACLVVAAVALLEMQRSRMAARRSKVPRPDNLARVSEYRDLLAAIPDATLMYAPASYSLAVEPLEMHRRFAESVKFARVTACLNSEAELMRCQIPLTIGNAMVEIVDRAIIRFFQETVPGRRYYAQVVCAVLPGNRNAFEVQGLPVNVTARLLHNLSALPSWPVEYPFVFVVQRRIRGGQSSAQSQIERPLVNWWRLTAPCEELSFAEIARRFHHIETPSEPVAFTVRDVEALRAQLPDDTELAVFHAEVLSATGLHRESLAIQDSLVESHPGEVRFRHLRVSCLEAADQLERAAAECQAILAESPADAATRGYLAHLQLRMGRPEDAIRTVTQALATEEQPRLYLVRAQARTAMGQFQSAMADLNSALSLDADSAGAYLLRSRLHMDARQFDETIADVDQYHRTAGPSFESLLIKSAALRAKGVPDEAAKVLTEVTRDGIDHPLLKIQRAECLTDAGKLELALEECDGVIRQIPEAGVAYVARAAVHLQSGRHEAALQDAERAVELGVESARVYLLLGLAKAEAGELEQGEENLTRALQFDPEDLGALYHRARLRALLGRDEAAIDDLSATLCHYPDWGEALVQRGYLRLKTEQVDAAMEDFEAAVRASPGMAEAYQGRANAHLLKGNTAESLADLNQALAIDPENVACRLARTNLLLRDDDRQGAKADLDAALQVRPELIPALFQRAQLNLSLGAFGAARNDFEAIIEQSPEAAFAYIGRSVAWEKLGNLEQSEKDLGEATHAAPEHAESLEVYRLVLNASAAHNNRQYDQAAAFATEAIQLDPGSLQAYQIRAAAYWYSERFVEAVDDYSHLIATAEETHEAYYSGRGHVYAELGEYEKALEDLNRAVVLAREMGHSAGLAYSLNGRGRALTGLGRYEEAEQDFAESLQIKPENAWLHFNRGLLYLECGQPEKAATCFDLSLNATGPRLTPRKMARARGFLTKMAQSRKSGGTDGA